MQEKEAQMFEGPLECHITAYFQIPESRACKKHLESIVDKDDNLLVEVNVPCKKLHIGDYSWSLGRNDWDNIGKSVCDGMKGIAWRDDGQISVGSVTKKYSDQPRVEIEIKEL